jgi:hypothetical protein
VGVLLGYGKRLPAGVTSPEKLGSKASKRYANDGRAPDTAEALAKLQRRQKRPFDISGAATARQPSLQTHGQSKRVRLAESALLAVPETLPDSPVRDYELTSSDDDPDLPNNSGSETSGSEAGHLIAKPFQHATTINVDGTVRALSTPSGNAWCYVGYKWANNSCAYDASLEILFMLLNCDTLGNYCTRLTAGTQPSTVSPDSPNQAVSISTLILILQRRMALYPLMPPAEIRSIIGGSRTMIQEVTLGSKYSKHGATFTSTWVSFSIIS